MASTYDQVKLMVVAHNNDRRVNLNGRPSALWLSLIFAVRAAKLYTHKRQKYQHLQEEAMLKARGLLANWQDGPVMLIEDLFHNATTDVDAKELINYTPEALAGRFSLRNDINVLSSVKMLWTIDVAKDSMGCIGYQAYRRIFLRCAKALDGKRFRRKRALEIINDDWGRDSMGQATMMFATFFDSVFELADLWCETIDAQEYCSFIARLARCISVRKPGQLNATLRPLSEVQFFHSFEEASDISSTGENEMSMKYDNLLDDEEGYDSDDYKSDDSCELPPKNEKLADEVTLLIKHKQPSSSFIIPREHHSIYDKPPKFNVNYNINTPIAFPETIASQNMQQVIENDHSNSLVLGEEFKSVVSNTRSSKVAPISGRRTHRNEPTWTILTNSVANVPGLNLTAHELAAVSSLISASAVGATGDTLSSGRSNRSSSPRFITLSNEKKSENKSAEERGVDRPVLVINEMHQPVRTTEFGETDSTNFIEPDKEIAGVRAIKSDDVINIQSQDKKLTTKDRVNAIKANKNDRVGSINSSPTKASTQVSKAIVTLGETDESTHTEKLRAEASFSPKQDIDFVTIVDHASPTAQAKVAKLEYTSNAATESEVITLLSSVHDIKQFPEKDPISRPTYRNKKRRGTRPHELIQELPMQSELPVIRSPGLMKLRRGNYVHKPAIPTPSTERVLLDSSDPENNNQHATTRKAIGGVGLGVVDGVPALDTDSDNEFTYVYTEDGPLPIAKGTQSHGHLVKIGALSDSQQQNTPSGDPEVVADGLLSNPSAHIDFDGSLSTHPHTHLTEIFDYNDPVIIKSASMYSDLGVGPELKKSQTNLNSSASHGSLPSLSSRSNPSTVEMGKSNNLAVAPPAVEMFVRSLPELEVNLHSKLQNEDRELDLTFNNSGSNTTNLQKQQAGKNRLKQKSLENFPNQAKPFADMKVKRAFNTGEVFESDFNIRPVKSGSISNFSEIQITLQQMKPQDESNSKLLISSLIDPLQNAVDNDDTELLQGHAIRLQPSIYLGSPDNKGTLKAKNVLLINSQCVCDCSRTRLMLNETNHSTPKSCSCHCEAAARQFGQSYSSVSPMFRLQDHPTDEQLSTTTNKEKATYILNSHNIMVLRPEDRDEIVIRENNKSKVLSRVQIMRRRHKYMCGN